MEHVITDGSQVTAEYLTNALKASGALVRGHVAQFDTQPFEGNWSRLVRIQPHYSADAQGDMPSLLLLKMCAGTFGPSEINYLTRDYADLLDAPIPRCYDSGFDAEKLAYHVLMQDVSSTHSNNRNSTPDCAYGQAVAEAVSILHARYAFPQQRHARGISEPTAEDIDRFIAHIQQGLEPLLEATENAVDPSWHEAIRDVFQHHPPLMRARLADSRGMTLVHGDLNPTNILSPHHGTTPVYLLDRQPFDWSLNVWLGVSDLAYAIVHWWPTEIRRSCEQTILQTYHASLVARGVDDYSWEQLWYDYRLAAVQSIYVAVEWCVLPEDRENLRWLWFMQLEKAMAAYFDLRCFELWHGNNTTMNIR